MHVLILAYGTRAHGMGHIMRCIVLADQLTARGVSVTFATAMYTPGWDWLARTPYPVRHVAEHVAPVGMGQPLGAGGYGYDALVVDLEQGPTVKLLLSIRATFPRVINIGCIGFKPTADPAVTDRLIDLQVYGVALFDPPRTACELAGPKYLLIDPAFAKCVPDPDGPIVVSMGGADPHNLTPTAIAGAADSGRPVRAVIGPASGYVYEKPPDNVTLLRHPESLIPILNGASVCVTATGMTAYEALAAGVPVLLTNLSTAHEDTADQLERRGVAVNWGLWDMFAAGLVRHGLRHYQVPADWSRASRRARTMVDGKGAARVTDAICQLIAAR